MDPTTEPARKRTRTPDATDADAKAQGDAPADVAARWMQLAGLRPWADNPRLNDGEPVRRVADSIKRFGWGAPILAREDGEVVAGHTRIKAAELLIAEYAARTTRPSCSGVWSTTGCVASR
jgi:hypothetical protein